MVSLIAPSLLAADYGRFAEEARAAEAAGADWLHLDIMDGHFVPNISFGAGVVRAAGRACNLPLDVHLMIQKPNDHLEAFLAIDPAPRSITVHLEAQHDVPQTIARIRAAGVQAGLALNPPTPLSAAELFLPDIDLLLVMTVNPGFGGQSFLNSTIEKIAEAAAWRRERNASWHIEVDGGITPTTAAHCRNAGASVFVAGTSVFGTEDYREAISTLRNAVR